MKRSLSVAVVMMAGVAVAQPASAAAKPDCGSYEIVATVHAGGGMTSMPWSYLGARAGKFEVCLDGPDGSDYDLVLKKFTLDGLKTVAAARDGGPDKTLSYDSPDTGVYRVQVVTDIEGEYTLGVNTP